MTCEECVTLESHAFRGPDDLVHAVQTAAQETDRGVLKRVQWRELASREQAALDSAFDSGNVPSIIRYRFECTSCGDRFELVGNTENGEGTWRRETGAEARGS
jgi:hypothetical protein